MPSSPSRNFTSYGDWLEMNADELAAAESRAEEAYTQAEREASGALGQAEFQARNQAQATGGAQGDITKAGSYSDYVRLRDTAAQAYAALKATRAPTANASLMEGAWRDSRGTQQQRQAMDYRAAEGAAQGRVAGAAGEAKASLEAYNKRLERQRQGSAVDTEFRDAEKALKERQQQWQQDTQVRGWALEEQRAGLDSAQARYDAAAQAQRDYYGRK